MQFQNTKVVACSVVEQLQWHQNSVQQWPIELRSTYCLVILKAIRQTLTAEQQGCLLTDATIKQLCQAVGCATGLGNIATDILQASAVWEQACSSHLARVTYSIQLYIAQSISNHTGLMRCMMCSVLV